MGAESSRGMILYIARCGNIFTPFRSGSIHYYIGELLMPGLFDDGSVRYSYDVKLFYSVVYFPDATSERLYGQRGYYMPLGLFGMIPVFFLTSIHLCFG
jgi:hypothetical protein